MKNFSTKVNLSGGDDSGDAIKFGANEFNSLAEENKTAVTSTGQTLTTGQTADTTTDQLARSLVVAGQAASSYTDSGSVNSYVLTESLATLVQPESYFDGMQVSFIPANGNTGASVINVSGLGSKQIRTTLDATIASGVLLATKKYDLVYISSFNSGAGALVVVDDKATTSNRGTVILASNAETQTGTDANKATTAAGVQSKASDAATTITGTSKILFTTPYSVQQKAASIAETAAGTLDNKFVTPSGLAPMLDGYITMGDSIALASDIQADWTDNGSFAVPLYRNTTFIGAIFHLDLTGIVGGTNGISPIYSLSTSPLSGLGGDIGADTDFQKTNYASTISYATLRFSSEAPTRIRLENRSSSYSYVIQDVITILNSSAIV